MALPASFPPPPKPPVANVQIVDAQGRMDPSWRQYFDSLYAWQVKLRAAL